MRHRKAAIENADVLVVVVDLHAPQGSALAHGMSQVDMKLARSIRVARMLRCRYMVITKWMDRPDCDCVPCMDAEALPPALDQAWRSASVPGKTAAALVVPDRDSAVVHAQLALTRAKLSSFQAFPGRQANSR